MEKKKKLTLTKVLRTSLALLSLILVGSACQPTTGKEVAEITLLFQ